MSESPDKIVTEKIIVDLANKGLLNDASRTILSRRLLAGDINSEDWRVLVEKDIAKSKEKSDDAKN
jgi:hypothetical protein